MTDILMPALSPTMEEGTLAKWNVKAGDSVKSGDVIAEIETDKATMEVEAVDEGVVGEILVPEGTEGVKVNAVIARLKGEGASDAPPPSAAAAPAREIAKPEDGVRAARDGSADETREARLQGETAERAPAPAPTRGRPPSAASTPPPQSGRGGNGAEAGGSASRASRVFASPLARRLAQQKGVQLSALKGSGPHGRIVKADVDAAQPGVAQPGAAPAPKAAAAPQATAAPSEAPRQVHTLEQMGIAPGSYDLKPLDAMKRTIARRMTESARDVPHFPLTIDLETDRLLAARSKLNGRAADPQSRISVNDILIKCAALALKAQPEANASYTPEGIALHRAADVAVAVAIDGGLITPIVRAAETRSLTDIARTMKDLAERARTRKLKPEEYQGGTFSISNLGMFGVRQFSSIINEPQGMILSVGVGEKRAVVRNDQLTAATMMTVTLTCDHRVVDGATGARWLQAFKGFVEDPITMLA